MAVLIAHLCAVAAVLTPSAIHLRPAARASPLVGGHAPRLHSLPELSRLLRRALVRLPALLLLRRLAAGRAGMVDRVAADARLPPELARPARRISSACCSTTSATSPAATPVRRRTPPMRWRAADHRALDSCRSQCRARPSWLPLALAGVACGAAPHIRRALRARNRVERTAVIVLLIACSAIAILTTVGIVLSLLFESLRFFADGAGPSSCSACSGARRSAMRADQVGSSGAFGAVPAVRRHAADHASSP